MAPKVVSLFRCSFFITVPLICVQRLHTKACEGTSLRNRRSLRFLAQHIPMLCAVLRCAALHCAVLCCAAPPPPCRSSIVNFPCLVSTMCKWSRDNLLQPATGKQVAHTKAIAVLRTSEQLLNLGAQYNSVLFCAFHRELATWTWKLQLTTYN